MAGDGPKPLSVEDLTFFTQDQLIDELFSRNDHAVFASIRGVGGSEGDEIRHRRFTGNKLTCMGLGTHVAAYAQTRLEEESEPVDEDDTD